VIGRLYGALPKEWQPDQSPAGLRPMWVLLDPMLRVINSFPLQDEGDDHKPLLDCLQTLPAVGSYGIDEIPTPVLVLPNVFEPEFCAKLIELYRADGGEETGFMREVEGKTVGMLDGSHKKRRDYTIQDPNVIRETQVRFHRRVVPEIRKVHQFHATRMERYIVSCYAAEDAGHFNAHRDNTTKGTAHRRFAVSINLNDDFDGGEVGFPEFGARRFKMPTGGAVVFSCSLLHAVSRVTRGRRYAFLPFLYDDEAAKVRMKNQQFLERPVAPAQAPG
jgi:predicted 2-oxoglutarate/Fe(II)-dependent dioxygenase YbiX